MKKLSLLLTISCISAYCSAQLVYTDLFSAQAIGHLTTLIISDDEKLGQIKHKPDGTWELNNFQPGTIKTGQPITEEWADDPTTAAKTIIGYIGVQNTNCTTYTVSKQQGRWLVRFYTCP